MYRKLNDKFSCHAEWLCFYEQIMPLIIIYVIVVFCLPRIKQKASYCFHVIIIFQGAVFGGMIYGENSAAATNREIAFLPNLRELQESLKALRICRTYLTAMRIQTKHNSSIIFILSLRNSRQRTG